MDRSEQLTRELYFVHKSGEHSVAYAVARIMALEALLREAVEAENLSDDLQARIKVLVPE